MGTPITYLSGGTMGYQSGVFKNATTALGFTFPLTSGYKWWNGVDVTSSQYLLYSDLNSVGQATVSNSRPTAWSTPDLTDQSLLNLINTLPERVGLPGFTSISAALQWLQNTGTYFLIKTGYENIVTSNLQLNYDAGWYNSYNGSGTAVYDISGNNRTGTLLNGTGFNSSGVGAFVFDGTDDYMEAPSFNVDTQNEFTLEAWIKLNAVSGSYSIIKKNTSNDNWPIFSISVAGGDLEGYYSSAVYGQCLEGAYTTNDPIVPGVWYHVAFSKGTAGYTSMKLYINGISVPYSNYLYGSHINNLASSTKPIHIGRSLDGTNWTQPFNGTIAMTKIYNRQLSDTEVLQNYNAQKGRFGITSPVQNGMVLQLDAANPASYPGTGTAWNDISGYGNNGTLVNGPTFSSANGGAISFDGADDYVNCGNNASLNLGAMTISAWVKPSTNVTTYRAIIADESYGGSPWNYRLLIIQGTGTLLYDIVSVSGSASLTSTYSINDNKWHYVCGVRTAVNGTVNLYIDGILNVYGADTSSRSTLGNSVWIGRSPYSGGQYPFLGDIAVTQIYNRALTAPEVQQNFYALADRYGVGIVRSGLVLNLDAGNYASYPTAGTTWYDISGNVLDATLLNGPTYSTSNGGTLVFDGTNDNAEIPYNTLMDPTVGLTLEAWVNPTDIAYTRYMELFRKEVSNGRILFSFQEFGTILSFGTDTTNNGYSEMDINISSTNYNNQWVHIVATYSSGYKAIYRNASVIGSTTSITGNLVQGNASYFIGSIGNASEFFYGKYAIFRLYNRALTSTEITQNFNADKARYGL